MCWCRLTAEEFPQGLPPRALPHLPQDPSAAGRAGCGQSQAAFRPRPLPGPPASLGTVRLLAPPWVPRPPAARRAAAGSPGLWCSWRACSSRSWSGTSATWAAPRGRGCRGFGWWRPHWRPSGNCGSGSGVWGSARWKSWRRTTESVRRVLFHRGGGSKIGQVPTATATLHTSVSDTDALPRSTLPGGVCKESFGGKSLRAIIIASAHEIMPSITFS